MESSNGMGQGSETISQPSSNSVTGSSNEVAKPSPSAESERTFRQSEVNEIVKKAKYGAVEDFKRLRDQQPEYAQNKYAEPVATPQQHAQAPEADMQRIAQAEILRMRSEWEREAQEKAQADMGQRIANDFLSKMNTGKEKYEDFDKVIGDPRSYGRFPSVVHILSQYVDNAADVLYELRKHGDDRLVRLEMTARDPQFFDEAISQAQRLSQALKDNQAASKMRLPNEPLSQMRPSNAGTDTGVMGVKDLRRKYRV
jgi:hypothetical protein